MDQHQRPLGLGKVPVLLLAITGILRKVAQVVLDLEGKAEEIAEAQHHLGIEPPARADDEAQLRRPDHPHPRRLLERHAHVVGFGEIEHIAVAPAEFERLSLGRLARHRGGDVHHLPDHMAAERAYRIDQRPERGEQQRIPRIDRQRHAVQRMERGLAAPEFAPVLHIVMNEEGIVQHLDRRRRAHRGGRRLVAEQRGIGEADRRPQHLPPARGVFGQHLVEERGRAARRQIAHDFRPRGSAIALEQGALDRHQSTSITNWPSGRVCVAQ